MGAQHVEFERLSASLKEERPAVSKYRTKLSVEEIRENLTIQLKRTLSYSYPVADRDSIAKNMEGRTDSEQTVLVMSILVGSVSDDMTSTLRRKTSSLRSWHNIPQPPQSLRDTLLKTSMRQEDSHYYTITPPHRSGLVGYTLPWLVWCQFVVSN